jgi:hypothetical protein
LNGIELAERADFGCGDAPGFVGSQVAVAERPFLQIIPALDRSQSNAVGVAHIVHVGACLLDPPGRRKSAFLVA